MHMAGSTTETLREEAESLLRALAGEHARLREDQWRAIEALCEGAVAGGRRQRSPRAPGAAHRVREIRGVLHRHRAPAPPRRGPHGDRLAAAGAHAQPDRRRPARRRARPHHQLGQPRGLGRHRRDDRRRRRRRAAHQPRAAQQPGVPRLPAAEARRGLRHARGRRGPLHLRLGPRLPARLPAHRHLHRGPPRQRAGPGDHRHRQRPRLRRHRRTAGQGTSRRPASGHRRRDARAPRQPRPRVPAAVRRGHARQRPPPRLARRAADRNGRLGHHLHPHRGRRRRGQRLPSGTRPRRRLLHRPHRQRRTPRNAKRNCSATASRRSWPPARSAWASTSPTSDSSSTWEHRRRRSRTTSRSAAPAAPATAPRWCCCPAARTGRSGSTSGRCRSLPRTRCGARSTCSPPRAARCRPRRWRRGSTCGAPGSR